MCRTCSRPVARTRDRIAVDGRYRHNLFNPAGILFEVECFTAAPGCRFKGEFTEAFTWFPGYAWRFALYAGCGRIHSISIFCKYYITFCISNYNCPKIIW